MKKLLALLLTAFSAIAGRSQDMISDRFSPGDFPLVSRTTGVTPIYVDPKDHWLVDWVAHALQEDIHRVTGLTPMLITDLSRISRLPNLIIVGSLDQSALIGQLAKQGRIPGALRGKWESCLLETIRKPIPGVDRALVIVGSDRRGTAYGAFELSRQMGVSPWYWWADVPVKQKPLLFFRPGTGYRSGPPAVKYRGIFINDEAPALSGWVREKYGGFNHNFYEKVFELILRLKGNYLWPAMWASAFNADDSLNPVEASNYGIVMGTSHHEPMLRSQQEWKRFGSGPWNYQTNRAVLDSFWKKGIENMDHHESIVTVGMRGDGDKPMEEHSDIALLEKIIADQRDIIAEVTGKEPSATPQSWALYKEVQDYYDKGMRVPDDITLLLCDDNWGDLRKLPRLTDPRRRGGYGLYYHFDYVGGPRNYKWLNTNPIPRVWEELHLAKAYGDDRIWIVNVGDIKPMEFPISFFMDYAWDPRKWPAERLPEYTREWAARQFGPRFADSIAYILDQYTKFNGRRKPELLSPNTYSLLNYREAEKVVDAYNQLARQAASINGRLPANYRDAFFQLVLFPVEACANLNDLYITAARNRLYASQGRAATNMLADSVVALFARDSLLSRQYNKGLAGGKWDHMMDQTHIGYTYWQEPPHNNMPAILTLDPASQAGPSWGVAVEGSDAWWPADADSARATLPLFNAWEHSRHFFEIFNRSKIPFMCNIRTGVSWVRFGKANRKVEREARIWVDIDWKKAPPGIRHVPLLITGPAADTVSVIITTDNRIIQDSTRFKDFVETDGCVSMEAAHYSQAVGSQTIKWQTIPGLGRTLSGVEAFPVTSPPQSPGRDGPHLEYRLYLFDTGTVSVEAYFSPILAFNVQPIRYAVSIDDDPPQFIDLTTGNDNPRIWDKMVADNIKISVSHHRIRHPGLHLLNYWLVDPGPVLQKIVVDEGGVLPSYLGPPESPLNR